MFRYWTAVRGLVSKMVMPEYNNGPFKLICDDFSPANMIVTEDLDIIAVVDWEWSYAGPLQLYWSPPSWLLLQSPHVWERDRLERYKHCLSLYISILEQEEAKDQTSKSEAEVKPSLLMRKLWENEKFWFHQILTHCVDYLSDLPYIELRRIDPDLDDLANAVSNSEVELFVKRKQERHEPYQVKIAETHEYINRRSVVEIEKMEKRKIRAAAIDPK
jgi:hypothetical protein